MPGVTHFTSFFHVCEFFPRNIFPAHFVGFLFSYFCRDLLVSPLFHENESIHCLCYSSGIYFLRYCGHLVKEIAKLLKTSERQVNSWSKVKTLKDKQRKLQGVDDRFFTNWVRNVIKKAVSMCVIIQQHWKVKIRQLNNIKVSSTMVGRYVTVKGWKVVKRKMVMHITTKQKPIKILWIYSWKIHKIFMPYSPDFHGQN